MQHFNVRHVLIACAGLFSLLLLGCTNNPVKNQSTLAPGEYLFATTSDYLSGDLRLLPTKDTVFSVDSLTINEDTKVRANNRFIYILERNKANNIMKLDPSKTGADAVLYEVQLGPVGSEWDPTDIVFTGTNTAFVSLGTYPRLLKINTDNGSITDSIDLRRYSLYYGTDSAAASPNASNMVLVNGKVYLLLQRLKSNGWELGDTSLVVVISAATDTVIKTIPLQKKNPWDLCVMGNQLIVACAGDMAGDAEDGSLEIIDLINDHWSRLLLTNLDLVGEPAALAQKSATELYVAVYVTSANGLVRKVKKVNISSGSVGQELAGIIDASGGIAVSTANNRLFVGERSTVRSGVSIFSTVNDSLIAGPVSSGLPPYDLAVFDY